MTTDRLPSVPLPAALACHGCRYGRRFVDMLESFPEDDADGEAWKKPRRRVQEGYYCTHPEIKDPTDASVPIYGRLWCAVREGGHP